ncbi:MAG: iron ABC transporter permease, partial [Desulfovibrionales bacterium]|nr:iron ABC transporter permease [Desulfovibrionales bacterium]
MSHFDDGRIPLEYSSYIGRKMFFLLLMSGLTLFFFVLSISLGAVKIPAVDVIKAILGQSQDARFEIIVM